jgi:hypothetical protein
VLAPLPATAGAESLCSSWWSRWRPRVEQTYGPAVGRRPDETNLRIAQFSGHAAAIQGAVRLANPDTMARSRDELSKLWEAIDAMLDLVDWR